MDQNTELLLSGAASSTRWEDEEKATNDVEQLREEFRRRLYGDTSTEATAEPVNGTVGRTAVMKRS